MAGCLLGYFKILQKETTTLLGSPFAENLLRFSELRMTSENIVRQP